jgi:hypothetical protein
MGRTFVYRCPTTGQNVQGLVEAEATTDGSKQYEAVECAACRGFHFVNISTLKLLSEEIPD